jgi:hypothetical protein
MEVNDPAAMRVTLDAADDTAVERAVTSLDSAVERAASMEVSDPAMLDTSDAADATAETRAITSAASAFKTMNSVYVGEGVLLKRTLPPEVRGSIEKVRRMAATMLLYTANTRIVPDPAAVTFK